MHRMLHLVFLEKTNGVREANNIPTIRSRSIGCIRRPCDEDVRDPLGVVDGNRPGDHLERKTTDHRMTDGALIENGIRAMTTNHVPCWRRFVHNDLPPHERKRPTPARLQRRAMQPMPCIARDEDQTMAYHVQRSADARPLPPLAASGTPPIIKEPPATTQDISTRLNARGGDSIRRRRTSSRVPPPDVVVVAETAVTVQRRLNDQQPGGARPPFRVGDTPPRIVGGLRRRIVSSSYGPHIPVRPHRGGFLSRACRPARRRIGGGRRARRAKQEGGTARAPGHGRPRRRAIIRLARHGRSAAARSFAWRAMVAASIPWTAPTASPSPASTFRSYRAIIGNRIVTTSYPGSRVRVAA